MTGKDIRKLRLDQLDARTKQLKTALKFSSARDGWIRMIRDALGISARQLAAKLGISQPTLAKIEKSELKRAVSLKTLDRIAEAIDCKVVYAFVPNDSFEQLVHRRALQASSELVKRVSHTMELEKQGISRQKQEVQIQALAEEMSRNLSKNLWENWK